MVLHRPVELAAIFGEVKYWKGKCAVTRRDIKGRPFWSRFCVFARTRSWAALPGPLTSDKRAKAAKPPVAKQEGGR
jgi:hypothetical protein